MRFLLILLSVFGLFACSPPPDQVVLARVEKEKIRVADLMELFKDQGEAYSPELLSDPDGSLAIKKKLLNGLMEERLLLQVAKEKKLALTREEEKSLEDRLKGGDGAADFEAFLEKRNISMDRWIEKQKRKELINKLLEQEITSHIEPSSKEIENYYRKYFRLFREPDRVRCRHIVANKEEKAKTILSLLKKGEPFPAVAKRYSESPDRERGGDLGLIALRDYPEVFDAACFTLATSQMSEVVPSPYGFHIFQVLEKKPGRQRTLREATPEIEKRIREEKGRKEIRKWLDDLHRNKKITVDEKALKEVPLPPLPTAEAAPETQPKGDQE